MVRNLGRAKAKQVRKRERRKERKKAEDFGTIIERRGRKIISFD